MRALTWQGNLDVQVTEVPDPRIQDLMTRSTAICGSDWPGYGVLGPYLSPGDVLGHEAMGVVTEVGADVTNLVPGDLVVIPFNISCGHCWMCTRGLYAQSRPRRSGSRARGRRCSATRRCTARPRAGRPSSSGSRRRSSARSRSWRTARTSSTCSCPTCCPPPTRLIAMPIRPRTARWPCSAWGRSGSSRRGSPSTSAWSGSSASTRCPSGGPPRPVSGSRPST